VVLQARNNPQRLMPPPAAPPLVCCVCESEDACFPACLACLHGKNKQAKGKSTQHARAHPPPRLLTAPLSKSLSQRARGARGTNKKSSWRVICGGRDSRPNGPEIVPTEHHLLLLAAGRESVGSGRRFKRRREVAARSCPQRRRNAPPLPSLSL
jgi:hypothetical protein